MNLEQELRAAEALELSEFLDAQGVRRFVDDTCEVELTLIERVQMYVIMSNDTY
jgi:hypothetical protein